MKKYLLLGGAIGAGLGLYSLFRNRPEVIEFKEALPSTEHQPLEATINEDVFLVASDGLPLALTFVRPAYRPVKAVVQIIHGILEHRQRYLHFAEFLAKNGFAVVISDNRGHGDSTDSEFPLGHMAELARMIQDQYEITRFIKTRFAGKPVYLYGHSFGSLLARNYLQKHDKEIEKLLLTGTVQYEKQAPLGCLIAKVANTFAGERSFSWILKKLSNFGEEDKSWLTSDADQLAKVYNDTRMIPGYDNRGVATIWEADRELKQLAHFNCQNPELPILSITGAEDCDITGGEKGLLDTENTLRAIGYRNVDMLDLPRMKHEVLNEVENEFVYQLIVDFFNVV